MRKTLNRITIKKKYSEEDDVNFETRFERNYENKNYVEERQ